MEKVCRPCSGGLGVCRGRVHRQRGVNRIKWPGCPASPHPGRNLISLRVFADQRPVLSRHWHRRPGRTGLSGRHGDRFHCVFEHRWRHLGADQQADGFAGGVDQQSIGHQCADLQDGGSCHRRGQWDSLTVPATGGPVGPDLFPPGFRRTIHRSGHDHHDGCFKRDEHRPGHDEHRHDHYGVHLLWPGYLRSLP